MSDNSRTRRVLHAITEEARHNPRFMEELERALATTAGQRPPPNNGVRSKRRRRRERSALDPFESLREGGPGRLRTALEALSLDQLRDVVAEYRIEPYTLAMKWKTSFRVIDLIVETMEQRSRKGEAFR